MTWKNELLVDCFICYKNKYLFVQRKKTDAWFPSALGSIWVEVPEKKSYYETLWNVLNDLKIKPKLIEIKAIANNLFYDTKSVFNVVMFFVHVDKMPNIKSVPGAEKLVWLTKDELLKHKLVLKEYKKVFPKLSKSKIINYSTEYDFDKFLSIKFQE